MDDDETKKDRPANQGLPFLMHKEFNIDSTMFKDQRESQG